MSFWNMSVPTGGSSLNLGGSPLSTGVTLTAAEGSVLTYSSGNTDVNADGHVWIQSSADAGICAASGVKLGTPAGVLATAGGNVDLWAGAGMGPSIPGPGCAAAAPAPPQPPCEGAKKSADRANALNAGIKGVADIKSAATNGATDTIGKLENAYGVLKGGWDVAKAANDALDNGDQFMGDGKPMSKQGGDVTDGVFGVVDNLMAAKNGDVPDVVGMWQSGKKAIDAGFDLAEGDAGAGGKDGAGTAAGGGKGGHGGGAKITIHAPSGIEKATDADMLAWAAGKIEYKAGSKITMNAGSKVETCSMVFEAHANVAATVRGLARVGIESAGYIAMNAPRLAIKTGDCDTLVAGVLDLTAGTTNIRSGDIDVDAASLTVKAVTTIQGKTTVKGPFALEGSGTVTGNFDVDENVSVGNQLEVTGEARFNKQIFSNGATIKKFAKLG